MSHDRASSGAPEDVVRAYEQLPIGLIAASRDRTFVTTNAAYRSLVGRSGFIGQGLDTVLPEAMAQNLVRYNERAYETGEPQVLREWRVELGDPSGGPVREVFADAVCAPWRDDDGAVIGLNCYVIDVTDRVRERRTVQETADDLERRFTHVGDWLAALQHALLPGRLPVLPDFAVGAAYMIAEQDSAAGGDWYDAVALSDGRVVLVVGDVVGHGVAATASMGRVRSVLRDRIDDGATPQDALAAIDRLAARDPAITGTTVCVAELRPDGVVDYCTAGHPPPLALEAGGQARFLALTGSQPLGSGEEMRWRSDRLKAGDSLLVYSDGLVERPGISWQASMDELDEVARRTAAGEALRDPGRNTADRICAQTLELLAREGVTDDVTLIAATRRPAPVLVALELAAEPTQVAIARREVDAWLQALGAEIDDRARILVAVSELVSNAVEHAYTDSPTPGFVHVVGELTPDGSIRLSVRDEGSWGAGPSDDLRGRGLAIVEGLLQSVAVRRDRGGTAVTVEYQIATSARLLLPGQIAGHAPDDPPRHEFSLVPADDERPVRVVGDVHEGNAEDLRTRLSRLSRGGVDALTVDLSEVTMLTSAGVAVLLQLVSVARRQGSAVELVAREGSPARYVLDVVGLPARTRF